MKKGPPKIEREYKNPLTVFQAIHSETNASAPGNSTPDQEEARAEIEKEELEKEDSSHSDRTPDDDFLFPVNFAF